MKNDRYGDLFDKFLNQNGTPSKFEQAPNSATAEQALNEFGRCLAAFVRDFSKLQEFFEITKNKVLDIGGKTK